MKRKEFLFAMLLLTGCGVTRGGSMERKEPEKPRANIRFLFHMCNDIRSIGSFYRDLLGMKEVGFHNPKQDREGYLVYQNEGLQLMFFSGSKELPVAAEWAMQPGYSGPTYEVNSMGIEVPGDQFASVVDRLKAAGVPVYQPWPDWRQDSYWGFTVRDPMGTTLEIYTVPKEPPASKSWPGR